MEIIYVNNKKITWRLAKCRGVRPSQSVSMVNAVSVTARFGLRWETCWTCAMVEKKRDQGFLPRLHCDSSGVYICKSVVNHLRHGNVICKCTTCIVKRSPPIRISEATYQAVCVTGPGLCEQDLRTPRWRFQWSLHM